jgi:hypothetical protein
LGSRQRAGRVQRVVGRVMRKSAALTVDFVRDRGNRRLDLVLELREGDRALKAREVDVAAALGEHQRDGRLDGGLRDSDAAGAVGVARGLLDVESGPGA